MSDRPAIQVRWEQASLCLVGLMVWIVAHRYAGIRHDAIFYAGQALHRLYPGSFQGDLFFQFGSQDRFTLFSPVYARAITWLGLSNAAAVFALLGQVAWFVAAAWLLRPLLRGFWYWLGLVLVFSLPRTYGSMLIFQYAEPFLTARSWAEPLALFAAGFVVRGRILPAAGCWSAATAMHPIMALPAGLLIGLMAIRPRRLLIFSVMLGIMLGLMVGLDVPPISNMFAPMDDVWLSLSVARSPFSFFNRWEPDEYHEPVLLGLVLLLGRSLADSPLHRKICAGAFGALIVGIFLSLIPAVWPSALLVQVQAWRVLWFVKVLSIFAATSLAQAYWHLSTLNRLLIGGLTACAVNIDYPLALAVALGLAAVFWFHNRRAFAPPISPMLHRIAWAVVVLVAALKIAAISRSAWITMDLFRPLSLPATPGERAFVFAGELSWFVGPTLLVGSCWLLRRRPHWVKGQLLMTASVLLACFWYWDATDPIQEHEVQVWERGIPEVSRMLKPGDLVYWDDGYRYLWFGLHRGSYASFGQAAGIVFSRQTAIEAERRLARLEFLGAGDGHLAWFPPESGPKKAHVELAGLIHVCHDPILDYVILSRVLPQGRLSSFSLVDASRPTWHLYDCSVLRSLPDTYADKSSLP